MREEPQVLVIEAPFVEPSLSRPEVRAFAQRMRLLGCHATAADFNVGIYRALVGHKSVAKLVALDRRLLFDQFCKGLYVGEDVVRNEPENGGGGKAEHRLLSSIRAGKDGELAAALTKSMLPLTSSVGPVPLHQDYVVAQMVADVVLGLGVARFDSAQGLNLCGFTSPVTGKNPEQIVAFATDENSVLGRIYDEYLAGLVADARAHRFIVVISQQSQLIPGMALAAWLKRHEGRGVAIAGKYLDTLLVRCVPRGLTSHVDAVIHGCSSEAARNWALGLEHRNSTVLGGEAPSVLAGIPQAVWAGPMAGWDSMALGPRRVAALKATSRCYWAKCQFCVESASGHEVFDMVDAEALGALQQKLVDEGIGHAQFLDYALPRAVLEALADAWDGRIRWCAQLRFERAFDDPALFERLRRAGCVQLSWGFESAAVGVLQAANKGGACDPLKRSLILRHASAVGIANHLFFIAGLPGETDADHLTTLSFLEANWATIHSGEAYEYQHRFGTGYFATKTDVALQRVISGTWLPVAGIGEWPREIMAEVRCRELAAILMAMAKEHRCNDLMDGHWSLWPEMLAS